MEKKERGFNKWILAPNGMKAAFQKQVEDMMKQTPGCSSVAASRKLAQVMARHSESVVAYACSHIQEAKLLASALEQWTRLFKHSVPASSEFFEASVAKTCRHNLSTPKLKAVSAILSSYSPRMVEIMNFDSVSDNKKGKGDGEISVEHNNKNEEKVESWLEFSHPVLKRTIKGKLLRRLDEDKVCLVQVNEQDVYCVPEGSSSPSVASPPLSPPSLPLSPSSSPSSPTSSPPCSSLWLQLPSSRVQEIVLSLGGINKVCKLPPPERYLAPVVSATPSWLRLFQNKFRKSFLKHRFFYQDQLLTLSLRTSLRQAGLPENHAMALIWLCQQRVFRNNNETCVAKEWERLWLAFWARTSHLEVMDRFVRFVLVYIPGMTAEPIRDMLLSSLTWVKLARRPATLRDSWGGVQWSDLMKIDLSLVEGDPLADIVLHARNQWTRYFSCRPIPDFVQTNSSMISRKELRMKAGQLRKSIVKPTSC